MAARSPQQHWRIDQLIDGAYRILPKSTPNSKEPLALTAVGASTPTLAGFDPKSDKARWTFKKPQKPEMHCVRGAFQI